jgi:hypothetical protein
MKIEEGVNHVAMKVVGSAIVGEEVNFFIWRISLFLMILILWVLDF